MNDELNYRPPFYRQHYNEDGSLKSRFSTKGEAKKFLKTEKKYKKKLEIYQCSICEGYHLGTKSKYKNS